MGRPAEVQREPVSADLSGTHVRSKRAAARRHFETRCETQISASSRVVSKTTVFGGGLVSDANLPPWPRANSMVVGRAFAPTVRLAGSGVGTATERGRVMIRS